jgi:hypothetical protein
MYLILLLVILLFFMWYRRTSSYACATNEATIVYNGQERCYKKGDYENLSGSYPTSKPCHIKSGHNTLIGYSKKEFDGTKWRLDTHQELDNDCWIWSLRVK